MIYSNITRDLYEAVESEEDCMRTESKRLEAALLIQVQSKRLEAALLIQVQSKRLEAALLIQAQSKRLEAALLIQVQSKRLEAALLIQVQSKSLEAAPHPCAFHEAYFECWRLLYSSRTNLRACRLEAALIGTTLEIKGCSSVQTK
jgi:hypothetical protein